jgi:hypothetical protein
MLQTSQYSAYETTWILQQETHWECGSQFSVACLLHEDMTWMPLIQDHIVFFNCQMEDQLVAHDAQYVQPVCSYIWLHPQHTHGRNHNSFS